MKLVKLPGFLISMLIRSRVAERLDRLLWTVEKGFADGVHSLARLVFGRAEIILATEWVLVHTWEQIKEQIHGPSL